MMRNLIALALFLVAACNSDKSSNKQHASSLNTFEKNERARTGKDENSHNYQPLTAKSQLVGTWTSNNKEPLTVDITSDSIYYTEHFESHKYSLKGDSIFICYPDFTFSAKVYFNNDTLVMESEDGKSKFYRFNN